MRNKRKVTELQREFAQVVEREKKRWRSYDQLALQIQKANRNDPELRVDRRKLKNIVDRTREEETDKPTDVFLNFRELQALDNYLLHWGQGGLTRVFKKTTLITLLANNARIRFLIGTKPLLTPGTRTANMYKTSGTSQWDVHSMIDITHDIHRYSTAVVIDVKDIFLRNREDPDHDFGQPIKTNVQSLVDDEDLSLICVGSPRACHASEVILAKMFDIRPFERTSALAKQLPFYFVWSDEQCDALPSSFALRSSDVPDVEANGTDFRSLGLKVTDPEDFFEVVPNKREWWNYGVIAAQRQESGQVWVVAAGLSGPSTSAAAKLLESMGGELLLGNVGRRSAVVWAVVKALVQRDNELEGEDRVLVDQKIVSDPQEWHDRTAR